MVGDPTTSMLSPTTSISDNVKDVVSEDVKDVVSDNVTTLSITLFYRSLLQKRRTILRSLLIESTSYPDMSEIT